MGDILVPFVLSFAGKYVVRRIALHQCDLLLRPEGIRAVGMLGDVWAKLPTCTDMAAARNHVEIAQNQMQTSVQAAAKQAELSPIGDIVDLQRLVRGKWFLKSTKRICDLQFHAKCFAAILCAIEAQTQQDVQRSWVALNAAKAMHNARGGQFVTHTLDCNDKVALHTALQHAIVSDFPQEFQSSSVPGLFLQLHLKTSLALSHGEAATAGSTGSINRVEAGKCDEAMESGWKLYQRSRSSQTEGKLVQHAPVLTVQGITSSHVDAVATKLLANRIMLRVYGYGAGGTIDHGIMPMLHDMMDLAQRLPSQAGQQVMPFAAAVAHVLFAVASQSRSRQPSHENEKRIAKLTDRLAAWLAYQSASMTVMPADGHDAAMGILLCMTFQQPARVLASAASMGLLNETHAHLWVRLASRPLLRPSTASCPTAVFHDLPAVLKALEGIWDEVQDCGLPSIADSYALRSGGSASAAMALAE